ncbi:hypothetical protein CAEBREN_29350 [Caenorhabditis brenneri]|uniref:G-protein coupled receptors family 1 profile domain-containing protein n=1 Tax=Caenorhabditis brenneri TaxID=135651 RepID=G0MUE4_CAEBE|nr:hypothetical protein CAEBREN_29350 [Caenorhabditis brenneri]
MSNFIDLMNTNFNMTLSYFILNGFQLNSDYYECDPNFVQLDHSRPFWGTLFIGSGFFIMPLYLTCLIVIAKSDQMKTLAYQVMMFLGVCDMSSTFFHSLVTGFLGYQYHFVIVPVSFTYLEH